MNLRFTKKSFPRLLSFFSLIIFLLISTISWSQLSITATGTPYTQNFDGMASSATATLPTGFKIGTDWSTGTTATTLAYGSTGVGAVTSTSSGGVINWGNGVTASATDRALGFLTTGTYTSPRSIIFAFTNNTGSTVTSIDLSWDYEKYRSGTRQFDWTFFYGNTSTASTSGTSGDQSYPADAANTTIYNPPTATSKSFSISGLSITNGSTYYLRWTFTGLSGSSNGQGIGIDNFSITANGAAPSPTISTSGTISAVNTTFGTASSNTSFSVSGANLTNDITVTAPTGFEISSNSSSGFGSSVTLTQSSGSLTATTIFIHLAASTPVGTYSDSIRLTSTGATSVAVYMPPSTVFANTGGVPTLYASGTIAAMTTMAGTASSPPQTFSVSGSNLGTNNISITAPSGFEISTSSSSGYANTLTLTPSADGFLAATIIYIHLSGSSSAGTYSGNVTISSAGATALNIAIPASTISVLSQTITFNLTNNKTNVDVIRIPVKSSSGLPITLSASPSNIVTITQVSGDTFQFSFTGVGVVAITASQAGNVSYAAATNIVRTINVLNAISKWNCDSLTLSATAGTSPSLLTGSTVADMGLQNGNTLFNGYHSSASTSWTTPSGNGSNSAISSNNWGVGDWYVFKTSTSDFHGIVVMFDQTSSSQGPKDFKLQYSLDSVTFTDYGNYTVPASATIPINWIKKSGNDSSQITIDLSSIIALNDAPAVWLRMVCRTTNSIGGSSTLNSGGTSRVDNFRVTGIPNGFYSRASNLWESNTSWNIFAGASPIPAPLGVYPVDSLCNVTIYGPHSVTTTGTDYAKNITLEGNLTLLSGAPTELNLAGNWYRSATGSLTQNDKLITFNGSSNATITATGGQSFSYLKLNKTGISNSLSLIDSISISKDFTIASGTFDVANKNVTLLSNATTGTASFGSMGASGAINYSGTGRFITERYIATGSGAGQHGRSWQLLAVPTTGDNQTIKAAWQEGAILSTQNPKLGYGIQLSGPAGTGSGFDTLTPFPSIKTYNSVNNTWTGMASTNDVLYNAKGYMVFVRGDRTVRSYTQAATPTILRSKGKLFANGNLPPSTTVTAGSFESIGNPYAAAVDFTLLTKTNVDNVFYVWDPLLTNSPNSQYGLGGYQAISAAAGYLPTPGGTTNYPGNTACTTIQSGQAFFVRSSSLTGTVSFTENSKNTNSRMVTRNTVDPSSIEMLTTNLFARDNNVVDIVDGNRVVFDNNNNNVVDENDVVKLFNGVENFSLKRAQSVLALETRTPISNDDTIFYHIAGLKEASYQLQFIPQHLSNNQQLGYLIDHWLNIATPISLLDTTYFNFNITSDAGSQQSDRFKLVFRLPSAPLPVNITSITAIRITDNRIQVNWSVENEINILQYELERSENGMDFTKITTEYPLLNSGLSNTYSYIDQQAFSFDNFYRVKAISQNGLVQYSAIIKVSGKREAPNVKINGNPVDNGILQLAFTNQLQSQVYSIQISNLQGQLLYKDKLKVAAGNQVKAIAPGFLMSPGIYQIKLILENGEVKLLSAVVH